MGKSTNNGSKSTISVWLPLSIVVILTFAYFNLHQIAAPQFILHQICTELGLEKDCNTDEALKEAASFGIPFSLISGFTLLLSVGILGACSNRIGRKFTLTISLTGQTLLASGWVLVNWFPAIFGSSWRIWVTIASCLHSASGGILVIFIGIYGVVSDITTTNPHLRGILFVLFDLLSALGGIGGAQGVGALVTLNPKYLLAIVTIGTIINIVIVLVVLPETIDPSIRSEPIDFKSANTAGQLAFLIPLKGTVKMLQDDADMIYDKINTLYEQQNHIDEGLEQHLVRIEHVDSSNNINHPLTCAQKDYNEPLLTDVDDGNNTKVNVRSIYNSNMGENENNKRLQGKDRSSQVDSQDGASSSGTSQADSQDESTSTSSCTPQVDSRGVPYLKLTQPPRRIKHRNSMLMLTLSIFFIILNCLGYNVVVLYYLKKMYKITPHQFANMSSIADVARVSASLIFFPLFKRFIKTATGEKHCLMLFVLIQAIAFFSFTFCQNYYQFAGVLIIYYLTLTFPQGLIRSLMANQVSQRLQKYVLSSLAAAEVFVFVFGGVGFNFLWLQTQKYDPHIILWVWGGIALLSSSMPFFIRDSREDFDLRVEMTTQYTIITTAEKAWEEQQQTATRTIIS